MNSESVILIIGHGASAADTPREWVQELRSLEARRQAQKITVMGDREKELDQKVRQWPRTPQNDPYKYGLLAIQAEVQKALAERAHVAIAFNEFCAPAIEDAVADLVKKGAKNILLMTTMFTRGGIHSETEIPEITGQLQKLYPHVVLRYAWPFDTTLVAQLFKNQAQAYLQKFN